MLTRREMMATAAAGMIANPAHAWLQPSPRPVLSTEEQKGDPDLAYQTVTFDRADIDKLSVPKQESGKDIVAAWKRNLPQQMLEAARVYKDQSLQNNPQVVSEFLELFNVTNTSTAYCAAAVSYCALRAYTSLVQPGYSVLKRMETFRALAPDIEQHHFFPTVSCEDMWRRASAKKRFLDARAADGSYVVPSPGWIVLFNWNKRKAPDHVGIVDSLPANPKASFFTMEFNTTKEGAIGDQRKSGYIDLRTRSYNATVFGYIKTDVAPG